MPSIDLTALNKDYSVYIPSMQIGSARNLMMPASKWQAAELPNGLEPSDFNFLQPTNKHWHYKYALASAETFRGVKNNAVSGRTGKEFILGDSGGFQIGKGSFKGAAAWRGKNEEEISALWRGSDMREEIVRWCEANCNYAMTIDIPLWCCEKGTKEKPNHSPFKSVSKKTMIELSVENLQYLCDVRGRWSSGEHNCKYLNVLQGFEPEAEQLWFDAVKGFKLDGWSLASGTGRMGGPYRILNRLLTMADLGLLEKGYDWIHILMLGELRWSPVMTAIQRGLRKNVNELITISYDSSSPYMSAGKFESYYGSSQLNCQTKTWKHRSYDFPTTWGYANSANPMHLNTTKCKGKHKCVKCQQGQPHLPLAMTSPIASQLTLQELISDTSKHSRRRVGKFCEELLINNNVFEIVYGMIRANDAVFGKIPNAPAVILDACGAVADIVGSEKWHTKLLKHQRLIEDAVGFKTKDANS